MQLFHSRSFDGIVPETPTKPKQAIPFMAHSSYVILLKKNYDTKGSVAAKSRTENTLFSGDHLAILRESIHIESVDLLSLVLLKYPPLSRHKWAQNKSELSNSKNVLNHDR